MKTYKGFNKDKTHKVTGTYYDEDGHNVLGFSKEGIHKETGTLYNSEGYDRRRFNREGKHEFTGTCFNTWGISKDGRKAGGSTLSDFTKEDKNKETGTKWDRYGYDIQCIHRDTGTRYNRDGLDIRGLNKEGKRIEKRWYRKSDPPRELQTAPEPQTALQRISEEISRCSCIKSFSIEKNARFHWAEVKLLNVKKPVRITPRSKTYENCMKHLRYAFGLLLR